LRIAGVSLFAGESQPAAARRDGVAGRSPAVKQVQVPACGGALSSLANLLDSSSTTCKGRTQLGRCPTGSKEPDPWRKTVMHTPISDPSNCYGFALSSRPAVGHAKEFACSTGAVLGLHTESRCDPTSAHDHERGHPGAASPRCVRAGHRRPRCRAATDSLAGGGAPEPWIGVEQAAEHLACPPSRIYDLVSQRRLTPRRDGRRLLFKRSHLDAAIEALS
jgi:excisionase family DNA binding protein